jgi:hypothetical protein
MARYVIEHLPRASAQYLVVPCDYEQAKVWLQEADLVSLVRTTELISAIDAAMGVTLRQSDTLRSMRSGDEALLIGLSFGVLLAWAEGDILPLVEDWRCLSLTVGSNTDDPTGPALQTAVVETVVVEESTGETSLPLDLE